jgi:hypothetical protein
MVLDTRPSLSVLEMTERDFETGYDLSNIADGHHDQYKHQYRQRHPELELDTFGSVFSEANAHTQ